MMTSHANQTNWIAFRNQTFHVRHKGALDFCELKIVLSHQHQYFTIATMMTHCYFCTGSMSISLILLKVE